MIAYLVLVDLSTVWVVLAAPLSIIRNAGRMIKSATRANINADTASVPINETTPIELKVSAKKPAPIINEVKISTSPIELMDDLIASGVGMPAAIFRLYRIT